MDTSQSNQVAKLRNLFGRMFDSRWSTEELDNFDELREKFVFHMIDAIDNVSSLAKLYESHHSCDVQQAEGIAYGFFLHALPHLMAAGQIYDFVPMVFPEQTGVHFENEALDECVNQRLQISDLQSSADPNHDAIEQLRLGLERKSTSLSNNDMEFAEGVSADLTMLRKSPELDPTVSLIETQLRDRLLSLLVEESWNAILTTLRQHERQIPTPLVAYFRGRCYFELGYYEVAVPFLRYATQHDRRYGPSLVLPLLEIGEVEEAKSVVLDLLSHVDDLQMHETFVLANSSCMLVDETAEVGEAQQWLIRSIAIFEAAFDKLAQLPQQGPNVDVFLGNYVAVAICCRMLRRYDDAKRWLAKAMQHDPGYDIAKQLYAEWFGDSSNRIDVAFESKTEGELISRWQPVTTLEFDRFLIKGAA